MERFTATTLVREPYAVVIFGWLGSTVEKLQVYDRMHRELGATLVVIIMCSVAELLDPEFVRAAVDANLEGYSNHPLVAHVFGNGGMLLYRRVFVDWPVAASSLTAVVFDSTPGKWFTLATLIGFSKSAEKSLTHRAFALVPLAFLAAVLLRSLVRRRLRAWLITMVPILIVWLAQRRLNARYYWYCVNDPVRAPALYLYSRKDALVNACVVERIVAERRRLVKKGFFSSLSRAIAENHVRARSWEDTAHVAHYDAHPEEYRREVESLLMAVVRKHKRRVPRVLSLPVLAEAVATNACSSSQVECSSPSSRDSRGAHRRTTWTGSERKPNSLDGWFTQQTDPTGVF